MIGFGKFEAQGGAKMLVPAGWAQTVRVEASCIRACAARVLNSTCAIALRGTSFAISERVSSACFRLRDRKRTF